MRGFTVLSVQCFKVFIEYFGSGFFIDSYSISRLLFMLTRTDFEIQQQQLL